MNIITLIENENNKDINLKSERGLCIYIEKDGKKILFDTGKSEKFISNAKKLGINIQDIDVVVISHKHHDHVGGLLSFLKENTKAKIYMKMSNVEEYYFCYMLLKKNIGINKKIFKEHPTRINYISNFTEILNDVFIITDINKCYSIPKGNKYLFINKEGKVMRDKFEHELIMVIKEENCVSIFTGCSHNGTVNMIDTVKKIFPNIPIKSLIGGFHLAKLPIFNFLSTSQNEIDILIKKIIDENIKKIYTGHCTGRRPYKKLKNALGNKIEHLSMGRKIHI